MSQLLQIISMLELNQAMLGFDGDSQQIITRAKKDMKDGDMVIENLGNETIGKA